MIDLEAARSLLDFGTRIGAGHRADEQLRGAVAIHNILRKHRIAYLADEVGMGKTYVALGALALFRHYKPDFRVLIIAPRENIQKKWKKELTNFAAQAVIANDRMTYGVTASNAGPNTATGVALTNTLPPGAILIGAVPANYTAAGSNLIFNLGALAGGGFTNFQFTIQPTNAGSLTLSASIGSAVLDTNLANNFGHHQHHRHQLPFRAAGSRHQFRSGRESAKRVGGTVHFADKHWQQ